MPKATLQDGSLVQLEHCSIAIPGLLEADEIFMDNLPDISDSKGASFTDEAAIGRSSPFKSFANSDNRTISWTCHFFVQKPGDTQKYIGYLRTFEACVYPLSDGTGGTPYAPPPICKLKCGGLLSSMDSEPICAVLKSYSVKFDTSVPWDDEEYIPYKMDVDLQFEVVYNQADLPGAERILGGGY